MKKHLFTMLLIASTAIVSNAQQQVIGMFPAMEGGFENQPAGAVSTAAPNGAANIDPATWTTSGSGNIVSDGTARTGANYFTYTSTSGSTKNTYSPAVKAPLFTNGTKYVVQFFYRAPEPNAGNQLAGLIATTDNTATTNFSTNNTYQSTANTNGAWVKFIGVQSLNPSYTPTTVFGGFRFNGGGTAIAKPFDIDDFVVYPADDQETPVADVTAPDPVTAATKTSGSTGTSLTWTAPATGIDGGGYMVVRSTSATPPALTQNGIYSIGNSIGTGATVLYLGQATSFTDNGSVAPLAPGTTYYYHVYTADKAFNYSTATTASGGPLSAQQDLSTPKALQLIAFPSPAVNQFTIFVGSASAEAVTLRITDILGRTVEVKTNVLPNTDLQLGAAYKAGIYLLEVQQGAKRKQLKIVKQ